MAHTEFGTRLLQRIFGILGEKITVEREPKLEGRSITAIIGRSTGGKKIDAEVKNQESAAQTN